MKKYINLIYDEILNVDNNTDIVIIGASSLRVASLILGKVINQIRLNILSLFRKYPNIVGQDIALVLTNNQMRSIAPLAGNLITTLRPCLDSAIIREVQVLYFTPLSCLIDLFFQLVYIFNRRLSWKYLYYVVSYFYYYKSFVKLFSHQRPRSVTITNPSHPILRSAIIAARELGIPTIYLPHASASPLYPTITTDYALLEGTDANEIYKFADYTQKLLVGSPRLDPYKDMSAITHVGVNILVAVNLLDDMSKVICLLERLKSHEDTKDCHILFRPHPNLSIDKSRIEKFGVEVISPQKETCLQSIQRSDILISANSTIFFEAIYLPIRCYYYDFVKDGLVKDSYNLESYEFIHVLNIDDFIDLSSYQISKEESDRIDVTFFSKERSCFVLKCFYANLRV